jgi:hypothetical protein
MIVRIPILAVAIMIGPSLAYGSPACMTKIEARAKFPNETLYSHQHCWNNIAADALPAAPVHLPRQPSPARGGARVVPATGTRRGTRAFPTTRTRNR